METEIANAQFLHDFKTGIHLVFGALQGVLGFVPFIGTGLSTKLVSAGLPQCVPPGYGEFEPVFHLLTHDHAFGIIIVECHDILALGSLIRDFANPGKILFTHFSVSLILLIDDK